MATPAEIALAVWGTDPAIVAARNKALGGVWLYGFPAKGGFPTGVSAQTWLQDTRIVAGNADNGVKAMSPIVADVAQTLATIHGKIDEIVADLTNAGSPEIAAIVAAVKQAIEEETAAIAAAVNDETSRRLES